MSIEDYTNEELLLECLITYYFLRREVTLLSQVQSFRIEKYECLKAEVLKRMEK